jgi:hypothetical protein
MKVPRQKENAEESGRAMSHTSGNGSGFATATESQALEIVRSGSTELADGKATGPRTKQGKQTSSRNATKHGVFSTVIVLKGESRAEYEAVLAGLRETLQPEGTLEELLVEKLATLVWRQRRLLMAEGAEIQKNMEFVETDRQDREREEAERIARSLEPFNNHGLIQKIQYPDVLERCLELLAELRKRFEGDGFNLEYDKAILEKIYGDHEENRLRDDLYDSYETWMDTSQTSEEERVREGYASPEQCRKNMLQEIDEEIRRLKRYGKAHASVETVRAQLETLRHSIPDAPGLDRLLRYEASLERAFDRTLTQLERLQRMRRGQSVPPPIKVDIDT